MQDPGSSVAKIGEVDLAEQDDWKMLGLDGGDYRRDLELTIYSENENTKKFSERFSVTSDGIVDVGPLIEDRT